jgi:hypothetical protein
VGEKNNTVVVVDQCNLAEAVVEVLVLPAVVVQFVVQQHTGVDIAEDLMVVGDVVVVFLVEKWNYYYH